MSRYSSGFLADSAGIFGLDSRASDGRTRVRTNACSFAEHMFVRTHFVRFVVTLFCVKIVTRTGIMDSEERERKRLKRNLENRIGKLTQRRERGRKWMKLMQPKLHT